MGLSGYLSSGAELGNMTGKAILSLLGTLIEEVGIFARGKYEEFYKLKYCSTVVYMVPRA